MTESYFFVQKKICFNFVMSGKQNSVFLSSEDIPDKKNAVEDIPDKKNAVEDIPDKKNYVEDKKNVICDVEGERPTTACQCHVAYSAVTVATSKLANHLELKAAGAWSASSSSAASCFGFCLVVLSCERALVMAGF